MNVYIVLAGSDVLAFENESDANDYAKVSGNDPVLAVALRDREDTQALLEEWSPPPDPHAHDRAEVQAEADLLLARVDQYPLEEAVPNDLLTAVVNLGRKARQLGMDEVREQLRKRRFPA